MTTKEVLIEELGEKRVKELYDRGLLILVEWAMIQYHEKQVKNLNISAVNSHYLTCMCCGLKDETVKDLGWKLCPKCDSKLSKSIDAVEKYRHLNPEFDGGGGA